MLEGLEISVIALSDLNNEIRFDAEYFKKTNLQLLDEIKTKPYKYISEFAYVTDGIHTAIDYCEISNVNLISATSPRENVFDLSRQVFISEAAHLNNPRTALKEGDVIVSTVGTIGNCAVVDKSTLPANSDRHVGIIRIEKDFSAYFLSTFLLSKYGKFQTIRESTGNVQLNLFLYKIRELIVPCLTLDFQVQIETLVKNAHLKLEQSKSSYTQAETLLLETLGLADFSPSTGKVNIKSFKDSFAATGRLDAEYFHPAKESAQDFLDKLPGRTVGEMFVSVRKLWQPDGADQTQLVQNYDLTDALSPFLDSEKEYGTPETIASTKKIIEKGDIIVSRLRSYLKEVALVLHDNHVPMVASTEFIVLRPCSDMRTETLLIYLRSLLPQLIFKWSQDGSNHPRFDEKELLNLKVPEVLLEHQEEIFNLVQSSVINRQQAKKLLEVAKRAVEIAIESDERAAMIYLEQQT